ncbi:MAG: Ig domain-containing protein [Paludibacteraceae bacterium]|nr:Ig domain-containing protein [Paludibacteraceae bacterium]
MNTRLLTAVRIAAMSVLACVCFVLPARADMRLNNPVGTDGYYRVKWDCNATGPNGEQGYWAESNDMEYDETFVLAIDLTGVTDVGNAAPWINSTQVRNYEAWVSNSQTINGTQYGIENTGVTLNAFMNGRGNGEYMDRGARLWRIRDNIYGATYNFAQRRMQGGGTQNWTPVIGEQREIYARVFPFATLFGVACHNEPTTKKGSAWGYADIYACAQDNKALFRFAPYTGTKTSVAFSTRDVTNGAQTYYDNDHYVETDGYGGPLCFEMNEDCCPRFAAPMEVNVEVKQGSTPEALVYEVFGNKAAATYAWQRRLHDNSAPAESWPGDTPSAVPSSSEAVGTVYDYWCTLYHSACDGGSVESVHYVVTIVENCPDFVWSIDGTDGLDGLRLYPGGWYELSCTTDAGAPTLTVSGTGVTVGTPTQAGNTTTVRITLAGNATGDISLTAASPAANGYQACSDAKTATITADCSAEMTAVRIAWDWEYDNQANRHYVADDGTSAVMTTGALTDNSDLWVRIPTGETLAGYTVYYLRNGKTGFYLHRGTAFDAPFGNDWTYTSAETGTNINAETDDYKWIFYENGGRVFVMNVAGYDASNWQLSFALHYRNQESNNFCNSSIVPVCAPQIVCGKLANQAGSDRMRARNVTEETVALPVDFDTELSWDGTAPANPREEVAIGSTLTFTASRTDAIHSINTVITYTSSDPAIATVDDNGVVTGVAEGDMDITATLETVGCFNGATLTYSVHVSDNCPDFVWAIDGEDGLTTPLYAGGWYDLSCTTAAGAPTLTVSGTGVTVGTPTQAGNTTTVRITLAGDATGDITLTAASPAANGYEACQEVMMPSVAECDGTAQSYKIEWFNYNGDTPFPQYWIHGGASVYLRDNNGRMEADIEHTDGQDEWFLLPTGNTVAGEPSYYIQNALTRRYLYRGPTHGNVGGAWEYAEALLGPNNAQTVDYQWVFYPAYTHSNGTVDTAIICVDGLTGTQTNIRQEVYMLHTRLWEATGLFSNPAITTPGMACGKMADQAGSPVFYIKHMGHPEHPVFTRATTLEWDATAPAATETVDVGEELDHTASRTDAIHSINSVITYASSDPTIATVDAATGHVTAVSEGTAIITATLETVGCFPGDAISYEVQVGECRTSRLEADPLTVRVGEAVTLTLSGTYADETGGYVLTDAPDGAAAPTTDTWTPDRAGTYTLRWEGTSAEHPLCTPRSNEVTITVYDCGPDATLALSATTILLGESVTLTPSALRTGETGQYTLTDAPDGAAAPTADTWTPDAVGTYTLVWAVSDAAHPDCDRTSAAVTLVVNPQPEPEPTVLIFDNHHSTGVWSDLANWAPGYDRVPTCADNVRITAPCMVDQVNAQADSCTLAGGTLTILPQGGLTIHGLLRRETGALQQGDVTIRANDTGNGALVLGEDNRSVPATVEYYSLAYDSETNTPTWQYIAAPVADRPLLSATYPDAQLYAWTATPNAKLGGNWQHVETDAVAEPFAGYCITQQAKKTYTISGTLADPVMRKVTCPYYNAGNYPGFSMAGNTWVAPIRVADMRASDFGIADATVYVYNTGTYDEAVAQQPNVAFGRGMLRGQYNALPIHAAYYMPDALQTIPPMQGFFVYIAPGKGASATLTLDYSRVVMDEEGCRTTATPMRAPARPDADEVQTMTVTVANALWSDRVWLLRGNDFTPAFDNGWDGRKVNGQAPVSLAVETEQDALAVAATREWEGTALSFAGHRGLPYTLTLNLPQTLSEPLWLLDRLTEQRTPVTDGATYSFTASDNDTRRFLLVGPEGEEPLPDRYLTDTCPSPEKFIHRGHLYIRMDNYLYDACGRRLR